MAGRRKKSLREQITNLEEQIQQSRESLDIYLREEKQRIKDMERQLQELFEQKRNEEAQQLCTLMDEHGLTVADLEALLKENRKKIG